jgi:hypothetical protein
MIRPRDFNFIFDIFVTKCSLYITFEDDLTTSLVGERSDISSRGERSVTSAVGDGKNILLKRVQLDSH